MRSFKLAICVWLLSLNLCWATTVAGIQWEVRTTGNDLNGGGFNTGVVVACSGGTDYSQQDSPHVAFDGATITASTSGTSATITITGYTVATTDKCNTLQIASGASFTPGFYAITGVNTGANTWTLDAAVSSGAGSAMVGRMGGGLKTVNSTWGSLTGIYSTGGDTVWLKSGTYTLTASINSAQNLNSTGNPIFLWGYQTTHGDSTGTRPLITSATNSLTLISSSHTWTGVGFRNINFSHTAGTRGDGFNNFASASNIIFDSDSFDGLHSAIAVGLNGLMVINNEIKNSVSHGILNDGTTAVGTTTVSYSNIHDNGGSGLRGITTSGMFSSLFSAYRNNNIGIDWVCNGFSQGAFIGNDIADSISDGFKYSVCSVTQGYAFVGNILYANGGYGADAPQGPSTAQSYNAYGANSSGARFGFSAGTGDVTLSADPFVNRAGGNFALNSTAGGGAALKGAGFPGVIPNAGTGIQDIGTLQSGTGGGGGTAGNSAFAQ